jgi:uncharacterized membrane protein YbhN (UPF0104 family)
VCGYAAGYLVLIDLNVDINAAIAIAAQSFTVVTTVLPISGIGQFGTYEGTWTIAFVLFGVPEGLAIVSGLTSHLFSFFYQVLLGLAGLLIWRRTRQTRLTEQNT